MKKKALLGVLAIFMIVALVSCDEASFDKLGQLMGGMGNNVYGIEPNMEDVTAVTSTIDNSVKIETDETGAEKIVIDLDTASEIIQKLSEIGTSTQKLNQTKEELTKPITVEGKTSEEIQTALQDKLYDVINAFPTEEVVKALDEKYQNAINDVKNAVETIKDKIPAEPTQADLATVVIINSLAASVNNLEEFDTSDTEALINKVVDPALAALDALKVTTEVSDIDVLSDFNITYFLSLKPASSSGTGTETVGSRGVSQEEYMPYVQQVEKTLRKVISLMSDEKDGVYVFNKVKYQRFILQMSAIRASYELVSYGLVPGIGVDFLTEEMINMLYAEKAEGEKINIFGEVFSSVRSRGDFSTNDLALYLLSFVFTEMDKVGTGILDVGEDGNMGTIFGKFISDNAENLKKSPIESLEFKAFVDAYNGKDEVEIEPLNILSDICVFARTTFVIASQGKADGFLSMALNGYSLEEFVSEQMYNLVQFMQGLMSEGE